MSDAVIKYDVFISYSRSDAAVVEVLASYLVNKTGLQVWMDKSRLQPGYAWRAEIEAAMNASASVLIAWGTNALGPVQLQERDLAYAIRDSRPSFRVFYCLLPNSLPPQGNWANLDTWIRFSSSLDEVDPLASVLAAIKGEAAPNKLEAELPDEPAPYRGLAAFGVDDVKFFYGRSAYVDEMAERLAHHPLLSLLGPSGSGKTSLLQAGLVARLKVEPSAGDHHWRWLLLRPGLNPLRALALVVARLHPHPDPLAATDDLLQRLKTKPDDLPDLIQSLLPPRARCLLAVDRLEELFTLCEVEEDRQAFLAALVALFRHPHQPAWVVVAMRADFYNQVGRYAELADEIVNHQVYLRPMEEREVAEIIEAPAAQLGAIFEKGLAKQLRADAYVRGEVSLPLLQHALDLLWRKRRGRWLTWDAYSEMGGVAGALRYHADRVVEGLNPAERETARRIFIRLIWLDEMMGTMAGRRVEKAILVNPTSASADDERVLQRLADERLLVLRGQGEQATAELIHDTLPLNWELLRGWVQEDREFLLWQQRLRADLAEWERAVHDEGGLLRGAALNEAQSWLADRHADLNPKELEFIKQSLALHQREQSARERLRRRIAFGLGAGLLIALALAGFALNQTDRANKLSKSTLARRLADQAIFFSETQLDLALLLSLEARTADPNEASSIYLPKLQLHPHLRSYLHGHGDTVTSVAFRPPGGELLASASDDGTIILWNVISRRPLAQLLVGSSVQVWCVAFSADGKTLASGGQDGSITLWDVASHTRTDLFPASQGPGVLQLAFSPDGRMLAAGLASGKIVLCDVASRQMLGSLNGDASGSVYSIAFRPDGRMLAAGHAGSVVTIWDVHSRQPIGPPLIGHAERVMSVAFSPDGRILASGGFDRQIILWEVAPGGQVMQLFVKVHASEGGILSVAFSPDGKMLAASDAANAITLWKVESAAEKDAVRDRLDKLETFNLHTNWIGSVAFSPDGRMLASASRDQTIILWNVVPESDEHLTPLKHPEPVLSVAFNLDGKMLASGLGDATIRLWDVAGHQPKGSLKGHQGEVTSVAFSPRDGELLASGSKDGSVVFWDVGKLERLAVVEQHRDGYVWSIAFSPNGKLLAAGGADWKINLFDVATRQQIGEPLEGHRSIVFTVSFSRDNRILASGSDDGTIILWDVDSGTRKVTFQPDRYQVNGGNSVLSLAFSPDEKMLASGHLDKTINLWDIQKQQRIAIPLKGHEDSIRSLAFSLDGKLLASSAAKAHGDDSNSRSKDHKVILWNPGSGQRIAQLAGHSGGVVSVAFSPDEKTLASGSEDRTVVLWDVSDSWLERACRIANRNLTPDECVRFLSPTPCKCTCPDVPPSRGATPCEMAQRR